MLTDRRAINDLITLENAKMRYRSVEENQFTMGAVAGLFTQWKPSGKPNGIPFEVGLKIAEQANLTRKQGTQIALTCKSANDTAKDTRREHLIKHGKSYRSVPYM